MTPPPSESVCVCVCVCVCVFEGVGKGLVTTYAASRLSLLLSLTLYPTFLASVAVLLITAPPATKENTHRDKQSHTHYVTSLLIARVPDCV